MFASDSPAIDASVQFVRPCPQNQRVWLRRSESKTEHLRSESSAKLRVQSSQAESLQGVIKATVKMRTEEMTAAHGVRVLSWPPSSPDLQPLDYTYWNHTKPELIAKIVTEEDRMNAEWDTHRKGIEPEFHRRLALLTAANGGHFE